MAGQRDRGAVSDDIRAAALRGLVAAPLFLRRGRPMGLRDRWRDRLSDRRAARDGGVVRALGLTSEKATIKIEKR